MTQHMGWELVLSPMIPPNYNISSTDFERAQSMQTAGMFSQP